MYRANNTLVYVQSNTYCAVQYIATMCASMHITLINMSEDRCTIHIVYSICCPIVGAIHIDYDNDCDCLQYLQ